MRSIPRKRRFQGFHHRDSSRSLSWAQPKGSGWHIQGWCRSERRQARLYRTRRVRIPVIPGILKAQYRAIPERTLRLRSEWILPVLFYGKIDMQLVGTDIIYLSGRMLTVNENQCYRYLRVPLLWNHEWGLRWPSWYNDESPPTHIVGVYCVTIRC